MSFMLFEKKMKDFFSSHYVKLRILLQLVAKVWGECYPF